LDGIWGQGMKNNQHSDSRNDPTNIWLIRLLILVVLASNIYCAIQFLVNPSGYIQQFDLTGEAGTIVIRSLGILFIMWNVPYAIAIYQPYRYSVDLISALLMQLIGFIGETLIYFSIQTLVNTKSSIMRFMIFDFAGLLLLTVAYILLFVKRKNG
jgi:hypothetical protein